MMLGSLHLTSFDFGPGTLAVILLGGGAAAGLAAALAIALLRRVGLAQATTALWGGALVLAGAAVATALVHQQSAGGSSSEDGRRAIERQAAELTQRALEPGSTLACLDAVSGPVADACEHALFAKPEAVAAAVDYVDAKLSLLTASVALTDREAELRPLVQRLRGTLEADRFGFVAHVLTTRGCTGPACADLKLLRDPTRVLANMTAHTFETRIGIHAAAWQDNGAATASLTPPTSVTPQASSVPPMAAIGAGSIAPPTTSGVATGGRVEFPSAASIPAVSIMTPEPTAPPQSAQPPPAEAKPAPPKRAATPRRQAPREQAASIPSPPHRPAAPPPQRPAAPPPAQAAPAAAATEQVVTPDPLPSHGVN